MDETTAIVAGGGIGGAGSAEFGDVGAGMQIGPHGSRILRSWDLLDEALADGVQPNNLVFRDAMTAEVLTKVVGRLPQGVTESADPAAA